MADRKENELTKANNFAYVRALDSNGNSIQISKSDLVSVLGGLLPEASYNTSGFADELFNVQTVDASLNIIYKFMQINKISFTQVINIRNTNELETNGLSIHYIATSINNDEKLVSAKRIDKGTNPYGVMIYADNDYVYFKTTKLGGSIYFIGCNVKVESVESLPQEAREVKVF